MHNPSLWQILIEINMYCPLWVWWSLILLKNEILMFTKKSWSISIHSVKILGYFNKNCQNYWPPKWSKFFWTPCKFINKWINCTLNSNAYFSFERVSFDHRIVSAKIHLSLCRNKKLIVKTSERHNLNDEYENFGAAI